MDYLELLNSNCDFKWSTVHRATWLFKDHVRKIHSNIIVDHIQDEFEKSLIEYAFYSGKVHVIIKIYKKIKIKYIDLIKYIRKLSYRPTFKDLARAVTIRLFTTCPPPFFEEIEHNAYISELEECILRYDITNGELDKTIKRIYRLIVCMKTAINMSCINVFKLLFDYQQYKYAESKQAELSAMTMYVRDLIKYCMIHNKSNMIMHIMNCGSSQDVIHTMLECAHYTQTYDSQYRQKHKCVITLLRHIRTITQKSDSVKLCIHQLSSVDTITLFVMASTFGYLWIIKLLDLTKIISHDIVLDCMDHSIALHYYDIIEYIRITFPRIVNDGLSDDYICIHDMTNNFESALIFYNLWPRHYDVSQKCTAYLLTHGCDIQNNHTDILRNIRQQRHKLVVETISDVCDRHKITSYDPNICTIIAIYESYEHV